MVWMVWCSPYFLRLNFKKDSLVSNLFSPLFPLPLVLGILQQLYNSASCKRHKICSPLLSSLFMWHFKHTFHQKTSSHWQYVLVSVSTLSDSSALFLWKRTKLYHHCSPPMVIFVFHDVSWDLIWSHETIVFPALWFIWEGIVNLYVWIRTWCQDLLLSAQRISGNVTKSTAENHQYVIKSNTMLMSKKHWIEQCLIHNKIDCSTTVCWWES